MNWHFCCVAMTRMRLWILTILLLAASVAHAQERGASRTDQKDLVSRGKYIVNEVAMCVQCHTPRDASGNLIREKYLTGAPVPVNPPPYPKINWALKAPAIAGLIGYTKEEGVTLLTQGVTRDGRIPSPPMPPFRLSRADAEAVVAYLKSLQ